MAHPVTVASWLVLPEPGRGPSVESVLAGHRGIECRGAASGRLVVVTESAGGSGLETVHRTLRDVRGVLDVALVAAFEDEGKE